MNEYSEILSNSSKEMYYYLDNDNYWHDELDDREVVVTIRCITYNHEKFIAQALEGFVAQKTNFRFEAIVHDDCSTDNTAEVIRKYAEKYPSIIKPIFEKENQWGKGVTGSLLDQHTRGKYVAMCEGDDYWTDPYKLQKQVDFLEAHPDCSLCFHNAIVHYEDGEKEDHLFNNLKEGRYTIKDTADNWIVPTASMVFRREALDSDLYKKVRESKRLLVGDTPLERTLGALGWHYAFEEPMCVYRIHAGGVTKQLAKTSVIPKIMQEVEYMRIFGGYSIKAGRRVIGRYSDEGISALIEGKLSYSKDVLCLCFRYAPIHSFKACVMFLPKVVYRKYLMRR